MRVWGFSLGIELWKKEEGEGGLVMEEIAGGVQINNKGSNTDIDQ